MRLAVTGPAYSGKSTCTRYLVNELGYRLINYTDYLKALAADALSSIDCPTTVADILADKGKYRAFLQELGSLVGFDQGAYVDELVRQAWSSTNVVFDCVRFQAQWDKLARHDFVLLRFSIDPKEQRRRAKAAGVGLRQLNKQLAHPAEHGIPDQPGEIVLDGRVSPEANFECVLLALGARGLVSRAQSA